MTKNLHFGKIFVTKRHFVVYNRKQLPSACVCRSDSTCRLRENSARQRSFFGNFDAIGKKRL